MKSDGIVKGQSKYGNATHLGDIDEFFMEPYDVQNAEVDPSAPTITNGPIWEKGKEVSEAAFGHIKWPFVMWYYKKHGG